MYDSLVATKGQIAHRVTIIYLLHLVFRSKVVDILKRFAALTFTSLCGSLSDNKLLLAAGF